MTPKAGDKAESSLMRKRRSYRQNNHQATNKATSSLERKLPSDKQSNQRSGFLYRESDEATDGATGEAAADAFVNTGE
jgi:hypothetical protein